MPTLHLGVIDVPYDDKPKVQVRRFGATSTPPMTTGEVAEILEDKYHPVGIFFATKEKLIARALERGLGGALESMMMGAPPTLDPFGSATSTIENLFKRFITQGEMEKLGYPGVPTKAALAGVNPRLKHPYAKGNPRRPSFVRTGHYVDSFRAWVD